MTEPTTAATTLAPLRDRRAWNKKSLLDWILPMVAVLAVWLIFK
tara:strand:- start:158 stop:289 length:132 start_codon:yes stop_codon:yes gene_type:complete